ncbi:hypothetical protein ABZ807_16920 [Micromonospora sp. NPDC047548]|uniref:hypothetical protein n=1 Tax=Micromonospora sp. NPDC047548 TaxID=3155624 RepID=UPI0033F302D7
MTMEATCTSIGTPSPPHSTLKIDDELKTSPQLNRWRPVAGIAPKITNAELITIAVLQAVLGHHRALRQTIESVNPTFNGELDLERHGGRIPAGVAVRVLQPILALTAVIWHN